MKKFCLYIISSWLAISHINGEIINTSLSGSPSISEETSLTENQLKLGTSLISYQAVAGTYQIKDEKDKVKGNFFYIAYLRTDGEKAIPRPLTFSFNGGPGASSVWMHMGLLGPKRVHLEDGAAIAPPFSYEDNPFSLLDKTDLVFIDPISTGFSRAAQGEDEKQFHGVQEDVKSVAEFIRLYTTKNNRWESPKFLIGASYGTIRAVELAAYLYEQYNLAVNGVALISPVLNFQTIDADENSNDLPFILYLPSYTAAAWAHQKLAPDLQENLPKALQQAKEFAYSDYALALLKGDQLTKNEKIAMAKKLSFFTGLKEEFIERMNLRLKPQRFMQELLVDQSQIIGRFDGRFKGATLTKSSYRVDYDPSMDALFSAFTSVFNQYVRAELLWKKDDEYRVLADVFPWNYGKDSNRYFSAVSNLREMLVRVPSFKVFVASGYFDLATPYTSADYTFEHLNVDRLAERLTMRYYLAGHMMYTDLPSVKLLSQDLHEFIGQALR